MKRAALAALLSLGCAGRTAPEPAAPPAANPEAFSIPLAAPESLGFDAAALNQITTYLRTEVDSAFPGAVVAVGRHGHLALLEGVGHYAVDDARPVNPATIYDLASVTKVVGLTTACMLLVSEGKLDLDAPVQRYVPEFRGQLKEQVKIRHLLTHSSGLPAWQPLFAGAKNRARVFALVDTTTLLRAPGDTFVYSDLGAILLTQVVERITGQRLDRYLAANVFTPLGMATTRYLPPKNWRELIAPTERDTVFRKRMLHGEVHDENAGRMDGVSGHAGLFSTAPDLARFAVWVLRSTEHNARSTNAGEDAVLRAPCSVKCPPPEVFRAFATRQDIPPHSTRALGWDTPSDSGYSSAGTLLSRRSIGHTGYTGTSIWMDPERDLFVILLTNRVHPTRTNTRISQVRPRVADLVVQALVAPER